MQWLAVDPRPEAARAVSAFGDRWSGGGIAEELRKSILWGRWLCHYNDYPLTSVDLTAGLSC
jgi:hypothetical protein